MGGWVQGQFDVFFQGGCGGFKTNLNKKVGARANFCFFSITCFFSSGLLKVNLIIFLAGGGFKTNLNKKSLSITFIRNTGVPFFSNGRVRQEGGVIAFAMVAKSSTQASIHLSSFNLKSS